MFVNLILDRPFIYFSIVFTVIVSIVLHELAHGWAAIQQGDDTPIRLNRMTLNPIVHMGMISLFMLLVIGIAFGVMPVNPSRFRHKHGDAIVSAAGPLMNLLLAVLALSGMGLWIKYAGVYDPVDNQWKANAQFMLYIFGSTNLVLFLFNLLPLPPLDGASILGSFSSTYRRWIDQARNPQVFFIAMFILFIALDQMGAGFFDLARGMSLWYLNHVWHAGVSIG